VILITGGLGFIGSHTTRALLDLGESCVVTRHHRTEIPEFLQAELGGRLIVEPLELEDDSALLGIGERQAITGIVHLADTAVHRLWRQPGDSSPPRLDGLFDGLSHVLQAAGRWGVTRVTIASTIGVYAGVDPGAWREDAPLPAVASYPIPTVKKCSELLASLIGGQLGLEVISVRPSAIWGPGGRPTSRFFALPALVHAAVRGAPETAVASQPLYAQDGGDVCYVKDCGRAIALIQTATAVNHDIYNIGSGHVTTNAEIIAAIRQHVPEAHFTLTEGRDPTSAATDPYLDLGRIHQDTGYAPNYDIGRGIADYIAWLRAGHDQ
jgi:UDP-glucose 4-epimerase